MGPYLGGKRKREGEKGREGKWRGGKGREGEERKECLSPNREWRYYGDGSAGNTLAMQAGEPTF